MLQPTQNRTATPTQASYKLASSEVSIEQINKQFSAQVLAPDNTPLPFVRVNILNNHIATYTDKRGNFRIVSADSVVQLEVKSVGYLPKYIELKRGSSSHIVLEEDNLAMNSKVEVTTGTSSKQQGVRGRIIRDSAQTVEPEDGWDLYGYYVDNNIELPADVVNNKIKGTVEISFEVKRNGNIAKAKVEKSLCNDCDEEALRLLKQGPHWKQKKGKRTRSKVKVQF
jgi:TonB family protein